MNRARTKVPLRYRIHEEKKPFTSRDLVEKHGVSRGAVQRALHYWRSRGRIKRVGFAPNPSQRGAYASLWLWVGSGDVVETAAKSPNEVRDKEIWEMFLTGSYTFAEIGERYDICRERVRQVCNKQKPTEDRRALRQVKQDARDNALRRMFNEGYDDEAIGLTLGVSVNTVRDIRSRLQLSTVERGRRDWRLLRCGRAYKLMVTCPELTNRTVQKGLKATNASTLAARFVSSYPGDLEPIDRKKGRWVVGESAELLRLLEEYQEASIFSVQASLDLIRDYIDAQEGL